MEVLKIFDTERFTDLGRLNLLMLAWFLAQANLHYCPSCLYNDAQSESSVKIDSKIIVSLHWSKSIKHLYIGSILSTSLQAAFMHANSISAKKDWQLDCIFALLVSVQLKSACKHVGKIVHCMISVFWTNPMSAIRRWRSV